MNINFSNISDSFILDLTKEELKDLQYMLTISFSKLLDDKIFCSSFNHQSKECNRRCELNLDLREKIADLYETVYEEEAKNNG